MKIFIYTCLALLIGYLSPAASMAQQHNFEHFSLEQGLPQSQVEALAQDSLGFIWVGTKGGGLCRFDGKKFKVFKREDGLPDMEVYGLIVDRKGWLWIAGRNSLSYFDGKKFNKTQHPQFESHGLGNSGVFLDKEGNIWGTFGNRDIFKARGDSVTVFKKPATDGSMFDIWGFYEGSPGEVSIFTSNGLYKNHKGAWIKWEFDKDRFGDSLALPIRFSDESTAIVAIKSGTWNANAYTVKKKGVYEKILLPEASLFVNMMRFLFKDRRGQYWANLVIPGKGLGLGKLKTDKTTLFHSKNGLGTDAVNSIMEDREGNIWIGTNGNGLMKYAGDRFVNITKADGLDNPVVWSIYKDSKKTIWMSFLDGQLWNYDGVKTKKVESWKFSQIIWGFLEHEGRLLFGAENHVLKEITPEKTIKSIHGSPFSKYSHNVLQKNLEGKLIYAVNGKPYVFENGKMSHILADTTKTIKGLAKFIEAKDGSFWAAADEGVHHFGPKGDSIAFFNEKNGLVLNNTIQIAEAKDGSIWAASFGEGITVFKNGKIKRLVKEKDGLPSGLTYSIAADKDGDIWVGTQKGACQIFLDKNGDILKITTYTTSDGFASEETNEGSIFVDADNKVYIGTINGLSIYDPAEDFVNNVPPPVYITAVKPFFKEADWATDSVYAPLAKGVHQWLGIPEGLKLPYHLNHLTFEFAGLTYAHTSKTRYSWMLEGLDHDWSPLSDKTEAVYPNIPPGDYAFIVRAFNNQGLESDKPAVFKFSVAAPFWEKGWFRLLMLTGVFGIAFGGVRLRIKSMEAQKMKLEKIVEERTYQLNESNEELQQTVEELNTTLEVIDSERKKSEKLLLNILPKETAEELKETGFASTKRFENVTVLFTDFKGFTAIAENMEPEEVVANLDYCFKAFDDICSKHGVEKIKTIGDAYMAAAGIPTATTDNSERAVAAALEMTAFMKRWEEDKKAKNEQVWEVRIGLHTGPVVAGIVGKHKFAYDIWGDTVNMASRMESSGAPGRVNISEHTYALLIGKPAAAGWRFEYRGKIEAKNKGEVGMYFVEQAG